MQDEAAFQDLVHIKLYGLIVATLTQRVQLDASDMLIAYSPVLHCSVLEDLSSWLQSPFRHTLDSNSGENRL